jgi:hypothetical protein
MPTTTTTPAKTTGATKTAPTTPRPSTTPPPPTDHGGGHGRAGSRSRTPGTAETHRRPPTARPGQHAVPPPGLPAGAPDTPACRALWAALHATPGATAADLARTARIGRSTATQLLAALVEAGLAERTPGGGQGRTRKPDHWTATTPPAAPTTPARTTPAPTGTRRASTQTTAGPASATPSTPGVSQPLPEGKLVKGQLRDLVAAQLRAHPDQDFTPTALARALKRSAGAVANACERLTGQGTAARTGTGPRRYCARSAASS